SVHFGAFSATIFADGHDLISHGTAFAFYSVEIVAQEVVIGFGIGSYPWMYDPEAFPLAIRAPCLALCIVPKLTIGLSALPALAFTGLLCVIQDTPCWLVMMGKVSLAKQLLEYYGALEEEDSDDDEEGEEVDEVEVRMTQLKKVAGLDPHCTGNNVSGAPRRIIGARVLLKDLFVGDPIMGPMFKTTLLFLVVQ
ncbi:hypothetical protein LINPERHAP2_LOCUS38086, partial [Linum perenne]